MPIASDPASPQLGGRLGAARALHIHALPYRQSETLAMFAMGFSDEETADALELALNTVRNHAHGMRSRLSEQPLNATRATAVAWAWAQRDCCMASPFHAVLEDHTSVRERVRTLAEHHAPSLPPRQCEVIHLHAAGLSDAEVGRALGISQHTARVIAHTARLAAVPPTYAATRANSTAWVNLHRDCCPGHIPAWDDQNSPAER